MSTVYLAKETSSAQFVVLKIFGSMNNANLDTLRRFIRGGKLAIGLDHPNLVKVLKVGEKDGIHFMVSEYVDGMDLVDLIDSTDVGLQKIATLVADVADAVHYLHQKGLVHRDIKPENILITVDGKVKITDFGLVKSFIKKSKVVASGHIIGTPSYMSPEQAARNSQEVSPLMDIFSIGCLLYFALTRHPPFCGKTVWHTLDAVLHLTPQPISMFTVGIPETIEQICYKCLEKNPSKRYQDAFTLSEKLRLFANSLSSEISMQNSQNSSQPPPRLVENMGSTRDSDFFFNRLKELFDSQKYEEILTIADQTHHLNPFSTVTKAWELVTAAKCGKRSRVNRLADYSKYVLICDSVSGFLSKEELAAKTEARSICQSYPRTVIDSFMPFLKGAKTGDIFADGEIEFPGLRNLFTTCFLTYMKYTEKLDEFKMLPGTAYISAWLNDLESGGSIGAHFHPGALLSAVYYPHIDSGLNDSLKQCSSIEFGKYPKEMGYGVGVPTLELKPQFGQVIIFPAYLGHEVLCQINPSHRISIASDLKLAYQST